MARQHVTVELDPETIQLLKPLGRLEDVLAQLVFCAAEGVRSASQPRRAQTDRSLRDERARADERALLEAAADKVLRGARKPSRVAAVVARERDRTDKRLSGERLDVDALLLDQREANEQLVLATLRAQELAEEAEAARGRAEQSARELRTVAEFREMFIGMLSHDLRSPLAAIFMSAEFQLNRGRLEEPEIAAAERILRSSHRMSRMISQLLDLTRARLGGGMPIDPKPMDLREVCETIVGEFDARVELQVRGDVTGRWDHDRLAEVLSNLVSNAIEHATPGTAVTVDAAADGASVVVRVSNRGEPIPPALLPHVFEPFRRAKQREVSASGNLGLGLYIARQIIISHGGMLEASSADGTTTFVIRLPRIPPALSHA